MSFLINNKDIDLYKREKKKKKKMNINLFNLIVIVRLIKRLLLIISFVNLKSTKTKDNLFFLNIFSFIIFCKQCK